jgi:hypothetical protein
MNFAPPWRQEHDVAIGQVFEIMRKPNHTRFTGGLRLTEGQTCPEPLRGDLPGRIKDKNASIPKGSREVRVSGNPGNVRLLLPCA